MKMSEMSAFVGERSTHVSEVNENVAKVDVGNVIRDRCFESKKPDDEVAVEYKSFMSKCSSYLYIQCSEYHQTVFSNQAHPLAFDKYTYRRTANISYISHHAACESSSSGAFGCFSGHRRPNHRVRASESERCN